MNLNSAFQACTVATYALRFRGYNEVLAHHYLVTAIFFGGVQALIGAFEHGLGGVLGFVLRYA